MKIPNVVKNDIRILTREKINENTKQSIKEAEKNYASLADKDAYCFLLGVEKWDDAIQLVNKKFNDIKTETIRRENIEEFAENFAMIYTPISNTYIFEFYAKNPNQINIANELQKRYSYTDISRAAQYGIYYFLYMITLIILIVILEVV